VSYDADNLYIVTWRQIKAMSWGFYNAYADEAFAVISQDFIGVNGSNASGFTRRRGRRAAGGRGRAGLASSS
jgi:hypothetical protein